MKIKLIILTFLSGLMQFCSSDKDAHEETKISFPINIYLEKKSPDNRTNAIIYSWNNHEKDNLLGEENASSLGSLMRTQNGMLPLNFPKDLEPTKVL